MLNSLERKILIKLSDNIPLSSTPYKIIAEEIGVNEENLLEIINSMHNRGIIRRIGGVVYHRKVGFKANAMVVWKVPEERVDEVGNIISKYSEVTHCYQRPTFNNWPYNLYSMIHGESEKECNKIINEISEVVKLSDYKILYSIKELKKSSIKYWNTME